MIRHHFGFNRKKGDRTLGNSFFRNDKYKKNFGRQSFASIPDDIVFGHLEKSIDLYQTTIKLINNTNDNMIDILQLSDKTKIEIQDSHIIYK